MLSFIRKTLSCNIKNLVKNFTKKDCPHVEPRQQQKALGKTGMVVRAGGAGGGS